MAKSKAERTWFTVRTGQLTVNSMKSMFEVVTSPEGNLASGRLKLQRVIGLSTVYAENLVGGSSDIQWWHGLVRYDNDDAQEPNIITRAADSDDNMIWLWREPWVLFSDATITAGGNDYTKQLAFDWQLRGGKGTEVEVGQRLMYVFDWGASTAFSTFHVSVSMLQLYWGL